MYNYPDRFANVYAIDTHMFGFPRFNAAYIVEGQELALIDTGAPLSLDVVREAIRKHGFSISEISYIFVTHCEHPDHAGNVGSLLKENSKAKVCINPVGTVFLTNPEIEDAKRRSILPPQMAARFGKMVPVPASRIHTLSDGEQVDLGNGEKLRAVFTPGHQPSGMVVYEEKNKGLFINDLCGLYLSETGSSWIFTPFSSDVVQLRESLKKIPTSSLDRLYLGHFGMPDRNPGEVIGNALNKIDRLLDIGDKCVREGKENEIAHRVVNTLLTPELEKVKATREDSFYRYLSEELIPSMSEAFGRYYLEKCKKK